MQRAAGTAPLHLTEGEKAALEDRLSMPDLFVQVFTDTPEGEEPCGYAGDQIEEAVGIVAADVDRGLLFTADMDDLQKAVLREAIEGSTWIANADDTPQAKNGARRVLESLAEKLEAVGFENIEVPNS
jgi:hypothetical protein